ncbi:MAG: hypothetical protein U0174_09495 [Polyangiaceae bacterium]
MASRSRLSSPLSRFSALAVLVGALSASRAASASGVEVDVQLASLSRSPIARAEQALRRVLTTEAANSLVVLSQEDLPSGTITRFEQRHGGYRVLGHGASVRESKATKRAVVQMSVATEFSRAQFAPVDRATAVRAAHVSDASRTELVWWNGNRGEALELTWEVLSPLTFDQGVPVSYRTFVDASTGEVRWRENRVKFMDKASVYPQNPVTTKATEVLSLSIPSQGGILQNDTLQAFNCIDKKSLKPVSFGGFNVNLHVCDVAPTATADNNGDFVFTPVDDKSDASKGDTFAEVSIYFHAAKAYGFFRELDGRPDAQVVASKPFSAVANLQVPAGVFEGDLNKAADVNIPLEPYSNAFFSPGGAGDPFASVFGIGQGTMWFGQGPERDYAYDADVVYHEFTHAVVDKTLELGAYTLDEQGLSAAPGGMNEGLADYFSSAIIGDPNVGEYASKDLSQNEGVIRTLDNTDTCPSGVSGEVHLDSTLFSGGLWSARASLPENQRRDFDRSLYRTMMANPGKFDLSYAELATLFTKGLKVDLPAGATALEAAMTKRGVFPKCARSLTYTDKPIGGALQYYAVGKQSINLALVPGVMSFSRTLSEKTGRKLQVKFTAKSLGGGGGVPGSGSSTPFTPVVLLKYDGAIAWSFGGKNASPNADVQQTGTASGGDVTFDLPDEVKTVSVQIANSGSADGVYGQVELIEVLPTAVPPAKVPTTTVPTVDGGGLGGGACSAAAPKSSTAGLAASLAGLALVLFARRRRSS